MRHTHARSSTHTNARARARALAHCSQGCDRSYSALRRRVAEFHALGAEPKRRRLGSRARCANFPWRPTEVGRSVRVGLKESETDPKSPSRSEGSESDSMSSSVTQRVRVGPKSPSRAKSPSRPKSPRLPSCSALGQSRLTGRLPSRSALALAGLAQPPPGPPAGRTWAVFAGARATDRLP